MRACMHLKMISIHKLQAARRNDAHSWHHENCKCRTTKFQNPLIKPPGEGAFGKGFLKGFERRQQLQWLHETALTSQLLWASFKRDWRVA